MAEETARGGVPTDMMSSYKSIGLGAAAAFAIAATVIGAAYAVGRIGSAALGAAAEKPELLTRSHPVCSIGRRTGRTWLCYRHDAHTKNIRSQSVKFYCIADENTARGFRLAGIRTNVAATAEQAQAAINETHGPT